MNTCKSLTIKGKKCRKKTKGEFCHLHKVKNIVNSASDLLKSSKINNLGIFYAKDSIEPVECPICFEEIEKEDVNKTILKCGHIHCINCISSLRNLSCPMCRGPLELKYGKFDKNITDSINKNIVDDREAEELRTRNALIAQFGVESNFMTADTNGQVLMILMRAIERHRIDTREVTNNGNRGQVARYNHTRVRHG